MYGLGVTENLPLSKLVEQFDTTLGTPEASAKDQAKTLAKYMVDELAPKFRNESELNKREIK
jgi:hypothetical protein